MSRIQLIDADRKHGEAVRSQLETHGFQVDLSLDIESARKKLHETVPDLVVIGLNIEDILFFEFYRWLCSAFPWSRIPRLFITGNKLTEIARELEIDSDEEIFSKPLDIARFISKVKKLLISRTGVLDKTDEDYLSRVPGRVIGSVSIGKEIGRGGMGAVFLGRQESLDREVAVKLLLPGMTGDPYAIQRFQEEARAIARLKSPHIVQIYDFGEIDHNVFYIIMEYLPGQTVEEQLVNEKVFPVEKAISVVSQVADGLDAAHGAGLVHRDIKPSNLLISERNLVTITDFGLVQPLQKTDPSSAGMVMGSPQYMAPEQAAGEPMDARSDIYSLGIVFYEMLVGRVPFSGENPIKIMLQQIYDNLPGLTGADRLVPAGVAAVIERMTEKEPAARFSNCRELLLALNALELKGNRNPNITVSFPGLHSGRVLANGHIPGIVRAEHAERAEHQGSPGSTEPVIKTVQVVHGAEETVILPAPPHELITIGAPLPAPDPPAAASTPPFEPLPSSLAVASPELQGTAPLPLLNQLQIEISRVIGPIGKVIFEKEIRAAGTVKEEFPFVGVPALVEKLAAKIGDGDREVFLEKIQHLIERHRK